MKIIYTFLFVLGILVAASAQQASQYSQYMLNPFGFNPAYAGLDHSLTINGVYRKQWVGLNGSPSTQQVNVHMPFYLLRGGVGILLESETLGLEQHLRVALAYNYQMEVGAIGLLSLGVSGGFVQNSLDGSRILTPEGNYEGGNIDHNDNTLPVSNVAATAPSIGAGVYFQANRLEIGLSAANVFEQVQTFETFTYQLARSYFVNVGWGFDVGRQVEIRPSALLKTDLEQMQLEFSALAVFNDNILTGLSFRGYDQLSIDAMAIIAGLRLNEKFTVAYSYDITLSTLRNVSDGSHEISIQYHLGKPIGKGKLPPVIYHPRSR